MSVFYRMFRLWKYYVTENEVTVSYFWLLIRQTTNLRLVFHHRQEDIRWILKMRRLHVCCIIEQVESNEGGNAQDDASTPFSSRLCSHSSQPRPPKPTVTSFPRDVVRYITSQASTAEPGDSCGASSAPAAALMMTRPAAPVAAACFAVFLSLLLYGVARMSAPPT